MIHIMSLLQYRSSYCSEIHALSYFSDAKTIVISLKGCKVQLFVTDLNPP